MHIHLTVDNAIALLQREFFHRLYSSIVKETESGIVRPEVMIHDFTMGHTFFHRSPLSTVVLQQLRSDG